MASERVTHARSPALCSACRAADGGVFCLACCAHCVCLQPHQEHAGGGCGHAGCDHGPAPEDVLGHWTLNAAVDTQGLRALNAGAGEGAHAGRSRRETRAPGSGGGSARGGAPVARVWRCDAHTGPSLRRGRSRGILGRRFSFFHLEQVALDACPLLTAPRAPCALAAVDDPDVLKLAFRAHSERFDFAGAVPPVRSNEDDAELLL